MKKNMRNVHQAVAGFGIMLLLWCIGALCYEYAFKDFDAYLGSVFYYLPNIVMVTMVVLLLGFARIGKKKDLKVLYVSSVIGVWLPVFAFICSCIFSDDGNILCWIYGFTLGLLLSPFHHLAWSTFDCVWTGDFGVNPHLCAGLLVVGIALSYVIYRKIKGKKNDAL